MLAYEFDSAVLEGRFDGLDEYKAKCLPTKAGAVGLHNVACKNGRIDAAEWLRVHGHITLEDLRANALYGLVLATEHRQCDTVRWLLRTYDVQVDDLRLCEYHPLLVAVARGDTDVAQAIVDHFAGNDRLYDRDAWASKAIWWAIQANGQLRGPAWIVDTFPHDRAWLIAEIGLASTQNRDELIVTD